MGHLINPISFRLYYSRYWNNIWNLNFNNINYSYINIYDYLINFLIKKFFKFYLTSIKYGIIFLNIKIIRRFENIIYNIYIHDSFYDMFIFKLLRNIKKILFPKTWFSWFKLIFLRKVNLRLNNLFKFFKKKKISIRNYFKYIINDKKYKKIYKNKNFLFSLYKSTLIKYYLFTYIKRKRSRIWFHYKLFLKFFLLFIFKKLNRNFWLYIKIILNKYLNFLFNCSHISKKQSNILYNILCVSKYFMWSKLVSDFISIRLIQNFRLGEILSKVNSFFYKLFHYYKLIKGYKIQCAGRFTRKQRASLQWKLFYSTKSSTLKSRLDYAISEVILRFGKCAIRVWIRKTRFAKKRLLYKF